MNSWIFSSNKNFSIDNVAFENQGGGGGLRGGLVQQGGGVDEEEGEARGRPCSGGTCSRCHRGLFTIYLLSIFLVSLL